MRGIEGAAVYDSDVPPVPEGDASVSAREARSTDAARLTFPVQMMIAAVIMTASIIGAVYGMTSGIRESQLKTESDMRDLRTRIEMQGQIDIARNDARATELKQQNEAIAELRRLTQLLQLQYQSLEKKVK